MSNTYTPNLKLAVPALGDRAWNVPMAADLAAIDALAAAGGLAVSTTETPSATLNVAAAAGSYMRQDGSIAAYAGAAPIAVTASTTTYAFLDLTNSGALTTNTTGFPTTAHVRLAIVVAGATTITSITDARVAFAGLGTMADGVNLTVGTVSGTKIGTATTQKLGFFGATPVVQPTMGVATAGATYTANEQTMLQAVYNAVRGVGLGS